MIHNEQLKDLSLRASLFNNSNTYFNLPDLDF